MLGLDDTIIKFLKIKNQLRIYSKFELTNFFRVFNHSDFIWVFWFGCCQTHHWHELPWNRRFIRFLTMMGGFCNILQRFYNHWSGYTTNMSLTMTIVLLREDTLNNCRVSSCNNTIYKPRRCRTQKRAKSFPLFSCLSTTADFLPTYLYIFLSQSTCKHSLLSLLWKRMWNKTELLQHTQASQQTTVCSSFYEEKLVQ